MHENLKADLEVDARKKAEAEIKRQHGEIALLKRHIRTVEKIAGATNTHRLYGPARTGTGAMSLGGGKRTGDATQQCK